MEYDFATIDPGLHIGIAYWNNGDKLPRAVYQCNCSRNCVTDGDKLLDLSRKIRSLAFPVDKVFIEGVRVYTTSTKSMAAASRGNLSLLAYIVGICAAAFREIVHEDGIEILSPQWKGQLDYKALAIWVERISGAKYESEHILATVGMGLYINGYMR